jgi:ribose-phosphate pyrophosphokinase
MASKQLVQAGAKDVIALVTHGILSGPAFSKLAESDLSALVVTNTIPQAAHAAKSERVQILDVSSVLAETIRRSYYGESISYLFDAVPFQEVRAALCSRLPCPHICTGGQTRLVRHRPFSLRSVQTS